MIVASAARLLPALLASSLLAFAAVHAAEPALAAYTIDTAAPPTAAATATTQASTTGEDWKVAISGAWSTQCPPTLESVALDGNDLHIQARSVLGLCARAATPFSIEVDPARALDRTSLPAGVYRVSFYAADGAQARPKLRAFSLVDHSAPGTAAPSPETGFWWSTGSGDRTALSLEAQGGQLSVALMSYDAAGQPQWFFGVAPFGGRTAHLALLRLQGGSDALGRADAGQVGAEAALTLDLEFHSAAHASAFLSRAGDGDDAPLRLRAFDVVRLPVADAANGSAWQGDWVLVEDSGAQRLHFSQFSAVDAEHFELADTAHSVVLACTRDAKFPELPPSSCALRSASGAEATLFDSVALQRMDGSAAGGATVHLLRVSN
jgi:hypothetical protein